MCWKVLNLLKHNDIISEREKDLRAVKHNYQKINEEIVQLKEKIAIKKEAFEQSQKQPSVVKIDPAVYANEELQEIDVREKRKIELKQEAKKIRKEIDALNEQIEDELLNHIISSKPCNIITRAKTDEVFCCRNSVFITPLLPPKFKIPDFMQLLVHTNILSVLSKTPDIPFDQLPKLVGLDKNSWCDIVDSMIAQKDGFQHVGISITRIVDSKDNIIFIAGAAVNFMTADSFAIAKIGIKSQHSENWVLGQTESFFPLLDQRIGISKFCKGVDLEKSRKQEGHKLLELWRSIAEEHNKEIQAKILESQKGKKKKGKDDKDQKSMKELVKELLPDFPDKPQHFQILIQNLGIKTNFGKDNTKAFYTMPEIRSIDVLLIQDWDPCADHCIPNIKGFELFYRAHFKIATTVTWKTFTSTGTLLHK